MADTCMCPPVNNIFCRTSNGLGIFQPQCQIVPNGDRIENPFFDAVANISYYTYGLINTCNGVNGNVTDYYVAICENIPIEDVISVDALFDGCPDFAPIAFDFENLGPIGPPPGYEFLHIILNGALTEGACAEFRIALAGNYPPTVIPQTVISQGVVTTQRNLGVSSENMLISPGCPAVPRLTVMKNCGVIIDNNMANVVNQVVVSNTGNADVSGVMFNDIVNYNGSAITIGTVTVNPDTINVDVSTPGIIRLTGDLGDIPVGGAITITYDIPVASISSPGVYTFMNSATATGNETQGSAQCSTTIEAVEFTTENCCEGIGNGQETFRMSVTNIANSPATAVVLSALLTVPSGVVVQFTNFDTCMADFVDTGEAVPLNTDVTNRQIRLSCANSLQSSSTMSFDIDFTIITTTNISSTPVIISNVIDAVTLQEPDTQIIVAVTPLPNTATIDVAGALNCLSSTSLGAQTCTCTMMDNVTVQSSGCNCNNTLTSSGREGQVCANVCLPRT